MKTIGIIIIAIIGCAFLSVIGSALPKPKPKRTRPKAKPKARKRK